jgi:GTP pyrophosphokinase
MLERIKALILRYSTIPAFRSLISARFAQDTGAQTLIFTALETAQVAHAGKYRLDGGSILSHPLAVAVLLLECGGVRESDAIAAALLHLFIEDVEGWDFDRLQSRFGMAVAQHVWYVSKKPGEDDENWQLRTSLAHERLLHAPRHTQLLKIFDRFNNLLSIEALPYWKQERMLRDTVEFYLPLCEQLELFTEELLEAIHLASRVNIR